MTAKRQESESERFARQLREAMARRGASARSIEREIPSLSRTTIGRALRGEEITASHYLALVRWMT